MLESHASGRAAVHMRSKQTERNKSELNMHLMIAVSVKGLL